MSLYDKAVDYLYGGEVASLVSKGITPVYNEYGDVVGFYDAETGKPLETKEISREKYFTLRAIVPSALASLMISPIPSAGLGIAGTEQGASGISTILKPIIPRAISSGISTAVGAIARKLQGDEEPLAPEKVATDAALGALAYSIYQPASGIASQFATTPLKSILASGVSMGATAGLTDLAEDYLRPAMYQVLGKEYAEKGEKKFAYPKPTIENGTIQWVQPEGTEFPKPQFKELLISVPIGFALGSLGKLGQIKYEEGKFWIPKIGRVKTEEGHSWTGLYAQAGPKAKPLIGLSKEGSKYSLAVGQPKWQSFDYSVYPSWSESQGYAPKTALERSLVEPLLRKNLPPSEAGKLNILKVSDKTYTLTTEPPTKEEFLKALKQSDRLKDISDDLMNYFQKQKNIFGKINIKAYGSVVQKAHMGSEMTRPPADLDISVPNPEKTATDIVNLLTKKGIKVRISPQFPSLIERYMNGKWVHLIDIHPYTGIGYGADLFGWGYKSQSPQQLKLDKGSMELMRLSEQGARKVSSTLTVWGEGKVAPVPHRTKDIMDAYEVQKFLVEQLPKSQQAQYMQILESWKNYWDDILQGTLKENLGAGITAIFAKSTPSSLSAPFFVPPIVGYFLPFSREEKPSEKVSKEISKAKVEPSEKYISEKEKPSKEPSVKPSEKPSEISKVSPSQPQVPSKPPSIPPSKPLSPYLYALAYPSLSLPSYYPSIPSVSASPSPSLPSASKMSSPSLYSGTALRIPPEKLFLPAGITPSVSQSRESLATQWTSEFEI